VSTAPLGAIEAMLNAVIERRLEEVLDSFSAGEDAYVFVEGPRWSTRGGDRIAKGWRAYFDAPIRIDSYAWVEGPFVLGEEPLALVAGILDYAVRGNGSAGMLRMRMSWLLRAEGRKTLALSHSDEPHVTRWRIVHEHGSQPLADPYGAGDWWPEGATQLPA
jgi:ketosteroid isomerase-like protein